MICDTRPIRKEQTLEQRQEEVRKEIAALAKNLAAGRIKVVIGPQGSIAFQGWQAGKENGISDTCAYRLIASNPRLSPLAQDAIRRAEILSGRSVNQKAIAAGWHLHGNQWHPGHK